MCVTVPLFLTTSVSLPASIFSFFLVLSASFPRTPICGSFPQVRREQGVGKQTLSVKSHWLLIFQNFSSLNLSYGEEGER